MIVKILFEIKKYFLSNMNYRVQKGQENKRMFNIFYLT